jgi:hypothetical protein
MTAENDKVVLKQTLMSVDEVFVYRIPSLKTSGGHRYVFFLLSRCFAGLLPCL